MIPELKKTSEQKMQKSLEALKADLGKVRTGRAHTGILDHVMVEYYGSVGAHSQFGSIAGTRHAGCTVCRSGKQRRHPERHPAVHAHLRTWERSVVGCIVYVLHTLSRPRHYAGYTISWLLDP